MTQSHMNTREDIKYHNSSIYHNGGIYHNSGIYAVLFIIFAHIRSSLKVPVKAIEAPVSDDNYLLEPVNDDDYCFA